MGNTTYASYRFLLGSLGISLMIIGGIVLLPLLTLIAYPSESLYAKYFSIPGGCSLLFGYLLSYSARGRKSERLSRQQDAVMVVIFWIAAVFVCSLPFRLSGMYSFSQAIFESASGWSTTGLSVVDVASAPRIVLMYRSTMLFFGGVGIVLVMTSILSNSNGMQLFNAEGHSDRLLPSLFRTSRIILAIYSGYIISGILLYRLFGMDWFDAINHSIAAISTGGFSTKAESIGYYKSVPIELVTVVLMLLGNISFLAHLYLIRGNLRVFFRYCEVRFSLFIYAICVPLVVFLLLHGLYATVPEAFRVSVFQVVSALTTTGFQTVENFTAWPPALIFIMCLLMLIGGGIGSTAGGIKQYRVYAAGRAIAWSVRDMLSFNGVVHIDRIRRPGSDEIFDNRRKAAVSSFIFLYLLLYALGVFVLTCFGYTLSSSLFEFASAMGTVGLSCGIMTYSAHPVILWTGTIGMFMGRLELYVVLVAFSRVFLDLKTGAAHLRTRAGYVRG